MSVTVVSISSRMSFAVECISKQAKGIPLRSTSVQLGDSYLTACSSIGVPFNIQRMSQGESSAQGLGGGVHNDGKCLEISSIKFYADLQSMLRLYHALYDLC